MIFSLLDLIFLILQGKIPDILLYWALVQADSVRLWILINGCMGTVIFILIIFMMAIGSRTDEYFQFTPQALARHNAHKELEYWQELDNRAATTAFTFLAFGVLGFAIVPLLRKLKII